MEVILRSDVEKLGLKGDVVDVKRGYARNYLLPRQLAEVATPGRIAEIRRIEEQRARHEAASSEQAAEIAATLTKTVLRFEVKAGPTGALFGSVTPTDIAEEIWRTRKIRVDRRKIDLDVIKRIGRFSIPVHVFEGVTAEVKTLVVPEGGDLPPEEELAAIEAAERAEAEAAERAHAEAVRATEEALAEEELEVEAELAAEAAADGRGACRAGAGRARARRARRRGRAGSLSQRWGACGPPTLFLSPSTRRLQACGRPHELHARSGIVRGENVPLPVDACRQSGDNRPEAASAPVDTLRTCVLFWPDMRESARSRDPHVSRSRGPSAVPT